MTGEAMAKISAKDMPGTIELLVAENIKLTRSLRKIMKWYDRNAHTWDGDAREFLRFFDLQDAADEARAVLAGVSEL